MTHKPKSTNTFEFLWGAATSAHQVEGDNHNDWSEWEKIYAPNAAAKAQAVYTRGGSVWQDNYNEATKIENYISGKACDQYHRFKEDFDIAKSLNMNAHRFSIEWSRIEPKKGQFDEKEINHYRQVIQALNERGIKPCVTLWHYTLPLWITHQGGWLNRRMPNFFVRFVERMVTEFKDDVSIWFTMNEPELYALHAYILGDRPPAKRNVWYYLVAMNRIVSAHKQAYKQIKQISPFAQVGVAKDVYAFTVARPTIFNQWGLRFAHLLGNKRFFNAIRNHQDFLGLNYYVNFKINSSKPGRHKVQDTGWEHTAEGLPWLLENLKQYHKPFIIAENGTIDAEDNHRGKYITDMLKTVQSLRNNGFDIRGYFHWSLIDNFEWNKGFYFRFGLINVDRQTLKRIMRPSAYVYSDFITGKTTNNKAQDKSLF